MPIRGNPVLLQLMVSKEPVAIEDLNEHPELNVTELQVRSPARALLVVPLLCEGKIIGSITLRQNQSIRHWNISDIDLAQIVATQAALAVQQSRLYQTTRQQAERLLEADRLKTEFFQNISHEFRTPLTLTIGPLESACRRKEDLPYQQAVIALRFPPPPALGKSTAGFARLMPDGCSRVSAPAIWSVSVTLPQSRSAPTARKRTALNYPIARMSFTLFGS